MLIPRSPSTMLVIVLVLSTVFIASADGYRHTAYSSGNAIRKVSAAAKEEILQTLDPDEAYAKFIERYKHFDSPVMLELSDPKTKAKRKDLFLKSLAIIRAHNKKYQTGETATRFTVNYFSVMDDVEKKKYLNNPGNVTRTLHHDKRRLRRSWNDFPPEIDWNARGYVNPAPDGGPCDVSWAIPATALLEFALKKATCSPASPCSLVQLSYQELIDCTYETIEDYDGCNGGMFYDAWDWVQITQHLSLLSDYPYRSDDGVCAYERYPNALEGKIRLTGWVDVAPDHISMMEAIQIMPLAITIYVEIAHILYISGVYPQCTSSHPHPNHGLLLTGYDNRYWIMRNGWGPDWGENGYARAMRVNEDGLPMNICGLLDNPYHITYENWNQDVTPPFNPVPPTDPVPRFNPVSPPYPVPPFNPVSPPYPVPPFNTVPPHYPVPPFNPVPPTDPVPPFDFVPPTDPVPPFNPVPPTDPVTPQTFRPPTSTTSTPTTYSTASPTSPSTSTPILVCSPGRYYNSGTCVTCPADTFNPRSSSANFCYPCPKGTTAPPGSSSADACEEVLNECWLENAAILERKILLQQRFTTFVQCLQDCNSIKKCKGVSVSPAQSHPYRECILLRQSTTRRRSSWYAATKSCFRSLDINV